MVEYLRDQKGVHVMFYRKGRLNDIMKKDPGRNTVQKSHLPMVQGRRKVNGHRQRV